VSFRLIRRRPRPTAFSVNRRAIPCGPGYGFPAARRIARRSLALEYEKAELTLRDAGIRSTIVCFGSARIPAREQAESEMRIPAALDERGKRRRLRLSAY